MEYEGCLAVMVGQSQAALGDQLGCSALPGDRHSSRLGNLTGDHRGA